MYAAEVAEMLARLKRYGLTRQQVAACLEVDRRSLYGWSKGSIQPTQTHLQALRDLAAVAAYLGPRAREVLTVVPIWHPSPLERKSTIHPAETWTQYTLF